MKYIYHSRNKLPVDLFGRNGELRRPTQGSKLSVVFEEHNVLFCGFF